MRSPVMLATALAAIGLATAAFGQCNPNHPGEFSGSSDSVRVLKHNWNALHSVGLTEELQAQHGGPEACKRFKTNMGRNLPGVAQVADSQRCLRFSDYGVGSFDSTKSNHCDHDSYMLVLHAESPTAWRLYSTGGRGTGGPQPGLIAEFDQNGKQTPSTAGSPGITAGSQVPASPAAPPKDQGDLLQKGLGDLIKKGIGR